MSISHSEFRLLYNEIRHDLFMYDDQSLLWQTGYHHPQTLRMMRRRHTRYLNGEDDDPKTVRLVTSLVHQKLSDLGLVYQN